MVMVLPADKGRATVIMDREEYMEKIKVMLSDEMRGLQEAEEGSLTWTQGNTDSHPHRPER